MNPIKFNNIWLRFFGELIIITVAQYQSKNKDGTGAREQYH